MGDLVLKSIAGCRKLPEFQQYGAAVEKRFNDWAEFSRSQQGPALKGPSASPQKMAL